MFPYEFCEISKNTYVHRTPLVAASENSVDGFHVTYYFDFYAPWTDFMETENGNG